MAFSLNDKHILLNYHYVENSNDKNLGTHPCSVKEFEKHIVFLSENYKPASISDVFSAAQKNSSEKYYSITFDDGLKSQYKNAAPILEKHGARGTFFPIMQTLDGKLPITHKVHILLSKISTEECINRLERFLSQLQGINSFNIPRDTRLSQTRRLYEDIPTANLKERFIELPAETLSSFIDSVFENLRINETKKCSELFMNKDEIKDIDDRKKFEIGNHTYSHITTNRLNEKELENDIQRSQECLNSILGRRPSVFSYPHGVQGNFIRACEILQKQGITHAVTVDRKAVKENTPFSIPRYDRVDVADFLETNVTA